MFGNELVYKSVFELSILLKSKQVSAVEVVQVSLECVEALNPKLNAFITVLCDRVLEKVWQVEVDIQKGWYLGLLYGILYGVKDIFATKGIRTTNGSKVMANWISDHESVVTECLAKVGAILVGKLN